MLHGQGWLTWQCLCWEQERRKAAELAAQNQALSRHLVETTASFREALQLVETLLGGVHIFLDCIAAASTHTLAFGAFHCDCEPC